MAILPEKSSKAKFIVHSTIILSLLGLYFLTSPLLKKPLLPLLGEVSNFQLTDSQNHSFSSDQLKGKVWIADFVFTTCAGPCPVMTGNLASIYRSYRLEKNVEFVSFTVNPSTDTPQVLAEYAKRFNADSSRWHFLTGPVEIIQRLAIRDFKIGHKDNPVFHSTFLVLVDRNCIIRGYYDGTDKPALKQLFKDTARLIKEKS